MNRFWEVGWVRIDFNEGGEAPMKRSNKKILVSIINLLREFVRLIIEIME